MLEAAQKRDMSVKIDPDGNYYRYTGSSKLEKIKATCF
jgi:hypothetical protein